MRNTADVTGGKPIAVLLQSISGVSAINPLVAFYDIHGGKREVLFFYCVPDTTRDTTNGHHTRHDEREIISYVYLLKRVKNACGMRGAVRGVTPLRSIRMRKRANNFITHFRVGRGARTVLY
jgi:hypothetical protein